MSSKNKFSELREAVFLILFRAGYYDREELKDQINDFFEEEDYFSSEEKIAIKEKVLAITDKTEEIDAALNEISKGWKTSRMTKVDLTILRLAYYEMKYDNTISYAISINEAVELAKNYGTENSGSFVNGILAKVAKNEQ